MGTIVKVICEANWQLWQRNCCFDLVFDGGLSALFDSWPLAFEFPSVCVSFHPIYLVICMYGVPQGWVRTCISLSSLYIVILIFSIRRIM